MRNAKKNYLFKNHNSTCKHHMSSNSRHMFNLRQKKEYFHGSANHASQAINHRNNKTINFGALR